MAGIGGAAAHSPNESGDWHRLSDHLREVGDQARAFGEAFGLAVPALWAGRWHDIGKATAGFQAYLQACVSDPKTGKASWAPHKMAGAVLAWQRGLAPLAVAIAGHHGGMGNFSDLKSAIRDESALGHTSEALEAAGGEGWLVLDEPPGELLSSFGIVANDASGRRSLELLTRFLFSCLVDADYLDTEAHFDVRRSSIRARDTISIEALEARLSGARSGFLTDRSADVVATDRTELYRSVVDRAAEPPGVFTLTAPTGSGKTLAALGFALAHARFHGLRRVVVAAPFVSITEQTAAVYRSLLDGPSEPVVLEHHSGSTGGNDDEFTPTAISQRLAAENWDAEVVVTTTVQLLDSLFSNRPSACRKLHRLAQSVIVIDEAQSIPFTLLDPTLDVLRSLCEGLGATVVLSTATQPPFERLPSMQSTSIIELVDDPAAWSDKFARVSLDYRPNPITWDEFGDVVSAEAARHNGQCVVVLNTIDDAATLTRLLAGTPGLVHLSTRLCPDHRRLVLRDVRRRLADGEPCVLVATQVVEAGVDVSFPVGVRVIGPAIALAQVAGRINRHGEQDSARLVVVDPIEGHCPPGDYRVGRDIARDLLREGIDVLGEAGVRTYYDRLFGLLKKDVDRKGIQQMRAALAFKDVATAYRVISEETVSVLVDWGESSAVLKSVRDRPARLAMRSLQPYLVAVRTEVAEKLREVGYIVPIPGFGLVERWAGAYDDLLGVQTSTASEEW